RTWPTCGGWSGAREQFTEGVACGRGRRVGVYFYDAGLDYCMQPLGLLPVGPFLAERALLVVDDSNEPPVQQANRDFVATHPACRLVPDLPTPGNGHPSFWNGLQVLACERTSHG